MQNILMRRLISDKVNYGKSVYPDEKHEFILSSTGKQKRYRFGRWLNGV